MSPLPLAQDLKRAVDNVLDRMSDDIDIPKATFSHHFRPACSKIHTPIGSLFFVLGVSSEGCYFDRRAIPKHPPQVSHGHRIA